MGFMSEQDESNYIQKIFYEVFRKYLPTWADVVDFSEKTGISQNTLRDIYYKDGQAGVQTMNRVLKELVAFTPDKIGAVIDKIHSLEPVPESTKIWNSIEASEPRKLKAVLIAKAVIDIENRLSKVEPRPKK